MGKKIIIAFVTYSLIVSFTLGFISIFALKSTLKNLVNQNLIQTKIIANVLDFIIQKNLNRLYDISLSSVINLKDNLNDERRALQNSFNYSLFNEGILLLDNSGNIITGYPEVYSYIKTIDFKNLIKEVSFYKKPIISPLHYVKDISKNLIFVMLPFRDFSNNFAGIICGIINLAGTDLNEFFKINNILIYNNFLQLVDNKGNTLYKRINKTTHDYSESINYIKVLNKSIKSNRDGIFNVKEEHEHLCTYTSLQYAPWVIVSCQDSTLVYTPIRYLLNFFILITCIYVLTGLIFATGLSKGIISPIKVLIDETKIIAAGDFSKKLNISGDYEIKELANSFENMRNQVRQFIEGMQNYNEKLESMVEERTKEIEKNKNRIESLLGLIMASQEEERKRIARELHDEPLQNLSVILMQLNSFKQFHDNKSAEEFINKTKDLLLKTNSNIRLIIQNLRPSVLDDLGLISAIKWVLENYLTPQGIIYFFDYESSLEDKRFPSFIETNIYRIVQEAIANICRHSQANEVHIKLIEKKNKLIINIMDNGIGFDVNKIMTRDINKRTDLQGIGLLGMYERATLLGGFLSITSKVNNGTTITLTIPLDEGVND